MSGTRILSTFLKKAEFLFETGRPLLPSSLCNLLGIVFAVVARGGGGGGGEGGGGGGGGGGEGGGGGGGGGDGGGNGDGDGRGGGGGDGDGGDGQGFFYDIKNSKK
ncbi:hypothetical protein C1645_740663 [Glomus cerebriforme]|uniref:Uncharacterized protein n=1 Tax=Glomus cerebriforme TaxID=658196 RepID=A0A397SKF4_9GLOM|nr:hypothetical protein C1645_740663 [Glomus cerebriforme]